MTTNPASYPPRSGHHERRTRRRRRRRSLVGISTNFVLIVAILIQTTRPFHRSSPLCGHDNRIFSLGDDYYGWTNILLPTASAYLSPLSAQTKPNRAFQNVEIRNRRSSSNPKERTSSTIAPLFASTSSSSSSSQQPKSRRLYFATCIPGLQNVLTQELLNIGASNVSPSGNSGVRFTSNDEEIDVGLKALMWVRTAHRIMELICSTDPDDYLYQNDEQHRQDENDMFMMFGSEPVESKDDLYNFIRTNIHPQSLLGNGKGGLLTLSVHLILNGLVPKELCHTHYTSLTVKNALVDSVRDLRDDGLRPDVDLLDADVPLVTVLRGRNGGRCAEVSLWRCLHPPGSLHKRGYRGNGEAVHKAALKESLAAGLLLEAGWDKLCEAARKDGKPAVLIDPMMGSGTLLVEGAYIAGDVAPGLDRIRNEARSMKRGDRGRDQRKGGGGHRFPPAVRWRDGNIEQWKMICTDATQRAKIGLHWIRSNNENYPDRTYVQLMGNEIHDGALALAQNAIERAGLDTVISVHKGNCRDWNLGGGTSDDTVGDDARVVYEGRTIIVTNPPWGNRLEENVEESWEDLKDFLRRECGGAEAWVLSGNKDLTRTLRMKKSRSVVVKTAEEDLRWIQYHVFGKKTEGTDERSGVGVGREGGGEGSQVVT